MLTIRCTHEKAKTFNLSYTLLVGQTYNVGRKGGDISFPDDQSVSRNHAEITVEHPMANVSDPLLIPTVVVTDLGSKFGTFTNEGIERRAQISMREPVNLSPGDRFRFGVQWNEFKIEYTPLVVTTSTLKEQARLKNIIMILGGHMVAEWSEKCNYCVMDTMTLTVKAVSAILAAKYIVTPAFFDDLYECAKTKKGHPNPSNFLPQIGEKSLPTDRLSLKPDVRRTQLFEGKTFLFANQKHLKKVGLAIQCGGGTSALITSVPASKLYKDNYIIMKPTVEYALLDPQVQRSIDIYKGANKRLIQDSEIGLAAVFISIEQHCNPAGHFPDNASPKMGSQTQATQSSARQTFDPDTIAETQRSEPSNSQVRSTAGSSVYATTVKQEPLNEKDQGSSKASKRNVNGNEAEGPSSKKRSADESLACSSGSKRLRSAGPLEARNEKALSALFGLSDSEDEAEEEIILEPDSPPPPVSTAHESVPDSMDVVPESLDVVPDSDDEVLPSVDFVPESPEVPNTSDDNLHIEVPVERRTTRSRGTTVPEPVADEVPVIPTSSSKRKVRSSEDSAGGSAGPSPKKTAKKQKTKVDSFTANDDLADQTKKMKIETKDENDKNKNIIPCYVPVLFRPLLHTPKTTPRIETVDGRNVKNFKTFKKVLPLGQQQRNNASSSKSSSRPVVNRKKLTFEVYEYFPIVPSSYKTNGPPSPQRSEFNGDAPTRSNRYERASVDFFGESGPSTSSRSESSRPKRKNELENVKSTTRAKKTEAPPPAFVPVFDDDEDEDKDDDIWGFN